MTDLMQPRFKVIADYPNRPLTMPIGHILTSNKFGAGQWWHQYTDEEPIHIDGYETPYPSILKKLEWWEDRKIEEMPEYVKLMLNGKASFVHKVIRWMLEPNNFGQPLYEYLNRVGQIMTACVSELEPATQEEYSAYQNKKTKTGGNVIWG